MSMLGAITTGWSMVLAVTFAIAVAGGHVGAWLDTMTRLLAAAGVLG